MYATSFLLSHYGDRVTVDVVERDATPFGLVRSGVAPDHASTKSVTNRFDGILADARVAFHGNVALGSDVALRDLRARYHAIILAHGADGDKRLGVPGEETMPGVYGAREFVGWYNGDARCAATLGATGRDPVGARIVLGHTACVFGLGNVALDCARMLLRDADDLASTDVAGEALGAGSGVERVVMIGRRGVAQAAFSPKELRELLSLPNVRVRVEPPGHVEGLDEEDAKDLDASRPRRRAREAVAKAAANTAAADATSDRPTKELVIKFLRSPTRFESETGDPDGTPPMSPSTPSVRVTLRANALEGASGSRRAVPDASVAEPEVLRDVSLVLRSVGYKGIRVDEDVPFDDENGVVPNAHGRVLTERGGEIVRGLYAAGWIKRGPTGIIGTNLRCAEETVGALIHDDERGRLREVCEVCEEEEDDDVALSLSEVLRRRGVKVVSKEGWARIDAAEREIGRMAGKPREKFVDLDEMLRVAEGADARAVD
ncbi:uncharacterized protein MICPUCDRAFT_44415 [Micromonas pusilla CCMP1545]|uniref:NADPH:adrenodoxin oxidoreductase, mitochondrial n=1 Tax=Micromonas pusilla (strain CCMP1545) TaxID=564608 RepID=C1MUK1_MICPC|nr:uncharacterized protein MICPUCDRAFT_44415 [Micromonas pusilla CCMP1545]EEH56343.1 predicted protein [Micromonas pusilla CCMP1545]|eukprot:XP_003059211.1 predicted protein [Micromonas pusilla CCMP1545]